MRQFWEVAPSGWPQMGGGWTCLGSLHDVCHTLGVATVMVCMWERGGRVDGCWVGEVQQGKQGVLWQAAGHEICTSAGVAAPPLLVPLPAPLSFWTQTFGGRSALGVCMMPRHQVPLGLPAPVVTYGWQQYLGGHGVPTCSAPFAIGYDTGSSTSMCGHDKPMGRASQGLEPRWLGGAGLDRYNPKKNPKP